MHSVGNKFNCYQDRKKGILSQLNCDFAVLNQLQYEVFLQDYLTMTLLTNIQHDTK